MGIGVVLAVPGSVYLGQRDPDFYLPHEALQEPLPPWRLLPEGSDCSRPDRILDGFPGDGLSGRLVQGL